MFSEISKTLILHCSKRFAGHSKWQNIKHIKGAKDAQRASLFVNLCRRIKLAVHEGGSSNPKLNLQLSQAVEVAKKQNMPISSIENCIKQAEGNLLKVNKLNITQMLGGVVMDQLFLPDKAGSLASLFQAPNLIVATSKASAQSMWYEIKGPGGSFIIASVLTDNHKRTRDTLAPIVRKFRASFADNACKYVFEQKGEIIAKPPSDLSKVEEAVVDHAIECGAEEVTPHNEEEGTFKFTCEINQLNIVTTKLQSLKYTIESADFNFIPKTTVELSDDDIEKMGLFMDKLQDHPDVVCLYDNVA